MAYGKDEKSEVAFKLDAFDFGALKDKPSKLANAGLLLAARPKSPKKRDLSFAARPVASLHS